MIRIGLLFSSSIVLALGAAAQQRLPASRSYPISAPVRNAGTVDVTTGKWTRAAPIKSGSQVVFNNTCTFNGAGGSYGGADWCEDHYDEGRVPSPSDPNAPNGAEVANDILSFQVTYCTFAGPLGTGGGYDMDVAFWDNLGGACVGGTPPTPPPVSSTATAYFPLGGLGLPGSTAVGFQACWIVTIDTSNAGFVLQSDGDGVFNGVAAQDTFTWLQRQNSTQANPVAGSPDGFFIAGDPAVGAPGSCTYSLPCGTGFGGSTCGTGLDTADMLWINVDGIGVGASGQPAGCPNSVAQYGFGTNCYFFGGYPLNPLASYWLVVESDGRSGATPFCTQTKPTTVAGCTASLTATDLSLATGLWSATNIPRQAGLGVGTVLGIFIYTDGVGIGQSAVSLNVPFGTLCLAGFKRSAPACAPATLAGAQAGVCNAGPMATAPGCNGGALGIAVGEDVNVQLWYRDPGAAGNADFSNAIFYTVQ